MKKLTLATALLAFAFPAQANDEPINKTVQLQNLDRAFEIAAAKLEMMTVIYPNECSDKYPAWCSFFGKGQLEIRGIAKTLDSAPSNISIYYTPDSDPTAFVQSVGLLVSICEPEMRQEERSKIIVPIIQIAGEKKKGPFVNGKNCDYSVTNLLGTIMVVAEKSSD